MKDSIPSKKKRPRFVPTKEETQYLLPDELRLLRSIRDHRAPAPERRGKWPESEPHEETDEQG